MMASSYQAHEAGSPRSTFLGSVLRGLDKATEVGFLLATVAFAAVMAVGVFYRYVLNDSLSWSDELGLQLFVWATFLSIATGYFHGKHVNVTTFLEMMTPRGQRLTLPLATGFEAAFLVCMLVASYEAYPVISGSHSDALRIPLEITFSAMPLAAALMLAHLLDRVAAFSIGEMLVTAIVAAAFVAIPYWPLGAHVDFVGGWRALAVAASFLLPLAIGVPVAFALGTMGFVYLGILGSIPFNTGALQIFAGTEIYTYMAIPLLMLAGVLLYTSGIAQRLVDFAMVLVGRMRGGLGATNVVASLIFADISGSAAADTAAIGSSMIPEMKRRGYKAEFCAALQASSGTLGLMFPPAIVLLLYATTVNVSVSRLFAASILPTLLVAASFMLVTYVHSVRNGYPSETVPLRQVPRRVLAAIPGLFAAFLVVGGILSGIITPAEAGVTLLCYVLILIGLLYRATPAREIYAVAVEAGHTSGMTLLLTATSALVGFVLARDMVPLLVADMITDISGNKYVVLFILNVIFIVGGMFLEAPALIVGFIPSTMPLLAQVGVDPIQWGVVFAINAGLGMLVPPVGLLLFVSSAIAKVSFGRAVRAAVPFMFILVVNLVLMSAFPIISAWLPHVLYDAPLP